VTDSRPTLAELETLLAALEGLAAGELKEPLEVAAVSPLARKLYGAVNTLGARVGQVSAGISSVSRSVVEKGQLGMQAPAPATSGLWGQLVEDVNRLSATFSAHVRELTTVSRAVARGELDQQLTQPCQGELAELQHTVNRMVEELRSFAADVARARELAAQAAGPRAAPPSRRTTGIWRELSENVSLAEQLALISRHKSRLLANMGHELRTPLNSLLVLAKVLSDNREANLTAQQVEYARTIYGSGGDLLSLLNDLLDLSKLEAGKLVLVPGEVDLAGLQDFCERNYRPVAEQHGLRFEVEVAPGSPRRIHTDGQRLRQILKNLLSNALKFTSHGSVRLQIFPVSGMEFEERSLRDAPGVLAFAVEDTGIGIPKEKQELIFEAFEQADDTTALHYGGTGLGLSICRELSGLLGGEIRLQSTPGRGSCFTLYLPTNVAETPRAVSGGLDPAVREGPPPAPVPALARRKILLIDDDVRHVYALASVLEGQQLQVRFAEGGQQGLDALRREEDIDLVLLDLRMPGMDGFETLHAIREEPRLAQLPIIVITGWGKEADRVRAKALGVAAYLAKPIETGQLVEAIRRSLPPAPPTQA